LKTLARYPGRYRRERSGKERAPPWISVEVAAKHRDSPALLVVLDGGRRVEVTRDFDVETLRRLVAALGRA